jgi:uncharacterized membrane protein
MQDSQQGESTDQAVDVSHLPFVAPCRTLAADAPKRWIQLGIADFKRAPRKSLTYGFVALLLCYLMAYAGLVVGGYLVLLTVLSGFTLIGPVLAIGLYSISCQLHNGLVPRLGYCLRDSVRGPGNMALFGSVLIVLFLLWVHVGHLLHLFFPVGDFKSGIGDMLFFFGIGSAVGAVFALLTFCISAFSLPMIMDRKTDLVTAIVTSINAVLRNRRTMLLWGAIIIGWLLFSILTGLLGLLFVFPVLGYATWHAYLETIDAGDWPKYD